MAYATTTHRAQGRTVDTTHTLVSPTTTREALYVGATRGRDANHIYVDTHFDPDPATSHPGLRPRSVSKSREHLFAIRERVPFGWENGDCEKAP